jgi:flagellar biogenesis protein FliO
MTVAGSLTFVLGLFCALAWLGRRVWPSNSIPLLPQGVLEVLGRSLLAGRQHLYLVRLGNKLLLVCVTAAGAQTLAEITEPMEVDRIAGLCGQNESGNITATFRQVLSQLGRTSHGRQPLAGQYRHRTASTA